MKLVTKDTAILAKLKGFNLITEHFYHKNGKIGNYEKWNKGYGETCSCPTQADLQEWLRDVHKLHINIEPSKSMKDTVIWFADVRTLKSYDVMYKTFNQITDLSIGDSYEEALEIGLKKALKTIK